MRKIKEVLRLRFGLGLPQNQIARSCSIGQATVHRYLEKAAAAGLTWPLPDDLDDRRLEEMLFSAAVGRPSQLTRALPDFDEVRRQLQTHKHLTLQLVWEEYRETQPDGYGYSRFCELYKRWSRNQDVVLRQEHRAGEKLFEYCQGSPRLIVPDNPRTGVDRACRYEPDLNRTYQEMAAHYGVAVLPARP